MPPLPLALNGASFTETAATGASFTSSGSVDLCANVQQTIFLGLHALTSGADPWRVVNTLAVVGPNIVATLTVQEPGPGPTHTIATFTNPTDADYFAPVAFTVTTGPWRLGVAYTAGTASPGTNEPDGAAEVSTLQYEWFSDETTTFVETVAGFTQTIYANRSAGAPGTQTVWGWYPTPQTFTDAAGIPGEIEFDGVPFAPVAFAAAHFTGVTVNGNLVETTGLLDHFTGPATSSEWQEVAAGAFDFVPASGSSSWQPYWAPGISLTYDVGVVDYSGANATLVVKDTWVTDGELFHAGLKTPTAASIPVNASTVYATQFTSNFDRPSKNPPSPLAAFQVTSPAPQTNPLWDSGDISFVLDQASPISGAASYTPITLHHKGAIEIDRTDGSRPSHWSVVQNGNVTENVGDTTFVNTGGLAIFQRSYVSHWRAFLSDPDPYGEPFSVLFHNSHPISYPQPEDVWWWNSYSFLHLTINASVNTSLAIQIDGVLLVINRTRGFGFTSNEVPERRIWNMAITAGTHDYYIDLSFPQSFRTSFGGTLPLWRPRVDTVEVKFVDAGTYVVSTMALTRRDTYANQSKVAFTSPSFFDPDWCCVLTRVDGEGTNALTYPDWQQKGFESLAAVGGSLRYAAFDAQAVFNAQGMWAQAARVEGFSFAYDDAQRAAFHRDVNGTDLVTELNEPSTFALEQTPGAAWAGAGDAHALSPPHALRVGKLGLVPGTTVTVKARKRIGGGIEAVGTSSPGTRAGAAQSAQVRDQNGTLIATVTTDARGRLHYEPLKPSIDPAVKFTLGSTYTGIGTRETSHDFAVATIAAAASGPYNLEGWHGDYYEAYIRNDDVWLRASDYPTPPMRLDQQVTTTADCSEPCIAMTPRRRIYLAYSRGAGVYERFSEDDGGTFTAEVSTFSGDSHPELCCSRQGTLLRAAYTGGQIEFRRQNEGDATATAAAFINDSAGSPLLVQNDTFRLAWEPRNIWWLHVRIQGDANPSLWFSADDGSSWTRFLTTFAGSRPGIICGSDGTFLLWTYTANTISTAVLYPGSAALVGPVTLKDATGGNFASADEALSWVLARENARRFVLVGRVNGETTLSTHWSADGAISASRFS